MGYTVLNITNKDIQDNSNSVVLGTSITKTTSILPPIYSKFDQAKENLINLILTVEGERVYHPTFGSNLIRYIFEPITDQLKQLIITDITETINIWLPYIEITNIEIKTFEDDPGLDLSLSISIEWAVNDFSGDPIVIESNGQNITVQ
jgi:phage baseplate assembly protein W